MPITTGSFPKSLQAGKPKKKRKPALAKPKKLRTPKVSKGGKQPGTMLDKLLKGTI